MSDARKMSAVMNRLIHYDPAVPYQQLRMGNRATISQPLTDSAELETLL